MNPLLIKAAKFVAQRPKDSTIRMLHIVSGLVIIQLLWYADSRSVLDIPFMNTLSPAQEKNTHLGLMIVGLILVLRGLIPWCILKHKSLRILQATIGLLLIIIGGPIMDPIVHTITAPAKKDAKGFTIDAGPTIKKSSHPGIILILLGALWFFVGLTGKGTTEKCLRYKEVVKKIRV